MIFLSILHLCPPCHLAVVQGIINLVCWFGVDLMTILDHYQPCINLNWSDTCNPNLCMFQKLGLIYYFHCMHLIFKMTTWLYILTNRYYLNLFRGFKKWNIFHVLHCTQYALFQYYSSFFDFKFFIIIYRIIWHNYWIWGTLYTNIHQHIVMEMFIKKYKYEKI